MADILQVAGNARATAPADGVRPPKTREQLESLAMQFESVLLGQMLREMRDSMFDEDDDHAKGTGFSGGPLVDQIYTELSLAIGRSGGVGLAAALGGALERQAELLSKPKPGIGFPGGTPSIAPVNIGPIEAPGKGKPMPGIGFDEVR